MFSPELSLTVSPLQSVLFLFFSSYLISQSSEAVVSHNRTLYHNYVLLMETNPDRASLE